MTDYGEPIKCQRCHKNEASTVVETVDGGICVCDDCLKDTDRVLRLVKPIPDGGIDID